MNPEYCHFIDIMEKREEFKEENKLNGNSELCIETTEQFLKRSIPKIERLVNPYIERYGLTLIGGTKGVGKSLFVTQLALHYASGISGFLQSSIEKPGRVLLIQQEVSEAGMQDRLNKMLSEGDFQTEQRFFLRTTTGQQLHLTEKEGRVKVIDLIERIEPDILILDPLYTFFPGELNQSKDMSRIISVLMGLKAKYGLSLVVVHHFSNKANPDEPRSTTGRFMGHSNLANAADVTVGIDFLHPRYKDQALPSPYNHYASVDTTTRHGEWPGKLYIERKRDELLFHPSSIWNDIGKIIMPDEIVSFINENGEYMLLKDVTKAFENKASITTIRKAIGEAIKLDKLKKEQVPGKHNMKMLRVVKHGSQGNGVKDA